MPESITKLQRWLDLIAYLVGRKYPVTVDDVLEALPAYVAPVETDDRAAREASRRMFERDKQELRAMGIPIETVTTTAGAETVEGYRLERGDFYLPYLRLIGAERPERALRGVGLVEIAPDEADAARDALRLYEGLPAAPLAGEARTARLKLRFDLGVREETPVLWAEPAEAGPLRERLRVLTDALLARKRVEFRYHGIYRGRATDRDVAGYGLLFQRGNWYLIGHDALRDDVRIFRVDRMEDVDPNTRAPETPDYDVPDDFDLAAWRNQEAWELGGDEEPIRATVAFRFPRSLWVARNGYGDPVEERPDGSTVRAFDVHQVDPFLRWVLSQEGEARILEPPELRDALHERARAVAERHRGPS